MIPTKFHTFVDGKVPAGLITAERLNKNFDELYKMFDPAQYGISEDNIAPNAKILISNRNYTGNSKITGLYEFAQCPIFPNNSIPDSYLSTNVAFKNQQNVFTAQQSFQANVNFNLNQLLAFRVEIVSQLPQGSSSRLGQIVFNSTDNKFYGWNGTEWKQLDYTGQYTGGTVRSYSTEGTVDTTTSIKIYFKTEGNNPTVKIVLKGEKFPARYYTELGQHSHSFSSPAHTHTITDPGHTHSTTIGSHDHGTTQFARETHTHSFGTTSQSTGSHNHSYSGSTGIQSHNHYHGFSGTTQGALGLHYHTGVEAGGDQTSSVDLLHTHNFSGDTTGISNNHTHGFSGNTSSAGTHAHWVEGTTGTSSANQQIPPADLGTKVSSSSTTGISAQATEIQGTIGNAGLNGGTLSTKVKDWANNLRVYIDNTEITNNILNAKGWQKIGDGTSTHPFHTNGTGELNISSWLTFSPGLHVLRIEEPELNSGCQVMIHIETQ